MDNIQLIEKPCKDCGKVELMAPSCERCLDCRVARMKKASAKTYRKNLESNRKKSLERYYKKKAEAKETQEKEYEVEKKKIFPVEYIEKEGKFTWKVRFFNERTNRYCVWESAEDFSSVLEAQQDYCKATR